MNTHSIATLAMVALILLAALPSPASAFSWSVEDCDSAACDNCTSTIHNDAVVKGDCVMEGSSMSFSAACESDAANMMIKTFSNSDCTGNSVDAMDFKIGCNSVGSGRYMKIACGCGAVGAVLFSVVVAVLAALV